MANHHLAPTRQILRRENKWLSPDRPEERVVRIMAETAGIKTPNNLTMLLTPSEIWVEATIRTIQIVHERMYVRRKNFRGETHRVEFMIATNRYLIQKISYLLIFSIVRNALKYFEGKTLPKSLENANFIKTVTY